MSDFTTPERDMQMLGVGTQCSASSCLLVDFLPFKCQHCDQAFCGEHFLPELHKCDKFDVNRHDRIAPSCPLCNTPVAIPRGQDPNIRMEVHISSECSVMTGKTGKKSSTPTCARAKCGKVLFAPILCDKCKQQFCPQHRFPNTHTCVPPPNFASAPARATAGVSSQALAASATAMAAIKRAMAPANATSTSSQQSNPVSQMPMQAQDKAQPPLLAKSSSSSSSTSRSNPFSSTDR
ncbi:hypothetical protein AcV7_009716 [Taiwanofungus camphoratus]|nr:hypothetical protein AcV7_009716 [Antrodia cinnamomea]